MTHICMTILRCTKCKRKYMCNEQHSHHTGRSWCSDCASRFAENRRKAEFRRRRAEQTANAA